MHGQIIPGRHLPFLNFFPAFLQLLDLLLGAIPAPRGKIQFCPTLVHVAGQYPGKGSNPTTLGPHRVVGMTIVTCALQDGLHFGWRWDIRLNGGVAPINRHELNEDKHHHKQRNDTKQNLHRRPPPRRCSSYLTGICKRRERGSIWLIRRNETEYLNCPILRLALSLAVFREPVREGRDRTRKARPVSTIPTG